MDDASNYSMGLATVPEGLNESGRTDGTSDRIIKVDDYDDDNENEQAYCRSFDSCSEVSDGSYDPFRPGVPKRRHRKRNHDHQNNDDDDGYDDEEEEDLLLAPPSSISFVENGQEPFALAPDSLIHVLPKCEGTKQQ